MEKDIQEILLTEEQINTRIAELGKELTADYAGKDPIIVGVLKGVVVFYADMIREIKTHCEMDFMWISSYAGTNSTGKMEVKSIELKPEVVDPEDTEMLSDLVIAAVNEALRAAAADKEERMEKLSGGLNVPGMF